MYDKYELTEPITDLSTNRMMANWRRNKMVNKLKAWLRDEHVSIYLPSLPKILWDSSFDRVLTAPVSAHMQSAKPYQTVLPPLQ